MSINVLMIAVSVLALVGCGPIEDGSVQRSPTGATTRAEMSVTPFSQYDYYPEQDDKPTDLPYYMVNGKKVDEPGWCGCGYGYE
ncbi:MAG TPA: hypothetical protein VMF50_08145 [Candidatus Binataceae bacterium]|nr:hypothetical protein [Candidatus Binataceae bacterium]